jgi:hypothetical protein
MGVLFSAAVVLAGSLEPSNSPFFGNSQMYTLDQIYHRINNGTAATKMSAFTQPSIGPTAGTMHTLDAIYDLAGQRAPVPKTGQFHMWATGDDGDFEKGVAWPDPRFKANRHISPGFPFDGTVTDNLTGLIWLRDANCFGGKTWLQALSDANTLASGICDLSDGSVAGDWRLPNVKELQSLIDFAYSNPALSDSDGWLKWVEGNPFFGVQSALYWSSTTYAYSGTDWAWTVDLVYGRVDDHVKTFTGYVWPVRGGQ